MVSNVELDIVSFKYHIFYFTEQDLNAQCLEPKMEIVNMTDLTKKDN
jgi:hypothetical protein